MADSGSAGLTNAETLVGILFILSIISERITNAFKLWASDFTAFNGKASVGNLRNREADPELEKAREGRILFVNMFFGFVTAAIVQVSMITVLGHLNDPFKVIGWSNISQTICDDSGGMIFVDILLLIAGWFLTGCFISLGSKFWHDLLDLLLEVKNSRNLLNQKALADLTQTDFSALSADQQFNIIRTAIRDNYETWRNQFSQITGASAGYKTTANSLTKMNAIIFQVSNKISAPGLGNISVIPATINYNGYIIPTDVVQAGVSKLAYGYCGTPGNLLPGCSISRTDCSETGTAGLKIYANHNGEGKKAYVLTSFHVLFDGFNPGSYNSIPATALSTAVAPGNACLNGTTIGTTVWGLLNQYIDAAVVLLDDFNSFPDNIYLEGAPTGFYDVQASDANRLSVAKVGMNTVRTFGSLISASSTQTFAYKFGNYTLNDLLQMNMVVDQGDSGAAVLDGQNRVVGIVVGTDGTYSYAIPISYIRNNFSFDLK